MKPLRVVSIVVGILAAAAYITAQILRAVGVI